MKRFLVAATGLLLLGLMTAQLVQQAWADSLTMDEPMYIRGGRCALVDGVLDRMPYNPPGFQLMAGAGALAFGPKWDMQCLPGEMSPETGKAFFPPRPDDLHQLILAARIPFIAMALLLAIVVFLWARALFGLGAGIVALAAISLEPTVLGHGHLTTGDIGVALGFVTCLACHWAWTTTHRRQWLVFAGLALGWSLICKVSAVYLLPILALIEVSYASGGIRERVISAVKHLLVVGLAAWAVICLVYLPFTTELPKHRWGAPLSWVVPPGWFYGVRSQLDFINSGIIGSLNGQVIHGRGPRYYFTEALLLKTTLGLLLLGLAGILAGLRHNRRLTALYLVVPILVVVGAPSLSSLPTGARYLLPAYPLLAILAGSLVALPWASLRLRTAVTTVLLLAAAWSGLAQRPYDIPYFNELAGARPARYLSDSNLDWAQDAWRLRDWWEAQGRPPLSADYLGSLPLSAYGIEAADAHPDREPVDGLFAVSVTRITTFTDSIAEAHPPYRSLAGREPLARIGKGILVYRLQGELVAVQLT